MFAKSIKNEKISWVRSVSCIVVLLILLFLPINSFAKKHTFDSGIPLSLGFFISAGEKPKTNLVGPTASANRSYSHVLGFEPTVDFGFFAIRTSISLHPYPIYSASGTNGVGTYSETADPTSVQYGADFIFAPLISKDNQKRMYVFGGYRLGKIQITSKRTYTNGQSYDEKLSGSGNTILAGLGFEFFFVQNYSLRLESGIRQNVFSDLSYEDGSTNLSGATATSPARDGNGKKKALEDNSGYVSFGLNLHF
ncbi:MAG: hypothetical protein M9962_14480 [Oligoflexia bacterium]|nr:hypothetical protein [Oligoflexia bacterium]